MSKSIGSRVSVLFTAATIVATLAFAGAAQAQRLKAPSPQPGTCKIATEIGVAPSAAAAQAVWAANVSSKFGNKWAIWAGAKDKVVVPINKGKLYQAVAKPCFYHPVP